MSATIRDLLEKSAEQKRHRKPGTFPCQIVQKGIVRGVPVCGGIQIWDDIGLPTKATLAESAKDALAKKVLGI